MTRTPVNQNHPVPTIADVRDAAAVLRDVARRTPILTSRILDEQTGCEILLKAENLQTTGAFKFRGAYTALAALPEGEGVVAYSSGNHSQAIARAARLQDRRAVIVMPEDAPRSKAEATAAYGAEIVPYDRYSEDRVAISEEIAAERGAHVIPPFDHPGVIAGQGTAALELFEDAGQLDALYVPVGGGGLLAGSLLASSELAPECAVIGVEPEEGDDVMRSVAAGEPVTIEVPRTIADGAQTTRVGRLTFPIIRDRVDQMMTVPDSALIETMRMLAERVKTIVEPTGCLGLAGALAQAAQRPGQRIGVILSGGNVDLARFAALLEQRD